MLCMICSRQGDVTITADAGRGYLAHYPACWDHVEVVCARLRSDAGRSRPLPPAARPGAVEADAIEVAGELPA